MSARRADETTPQPRSWSLEPFTFELSYDGSAPWESLADLVEVLTAVTMVGGTLLRRATEDLQAAQRRGEVETVPVGEDRLAGLAERVHSSRRLLAGAGVTICRVLEDYPELAEVLPDPEALLEPEGEPGPVEVSTPGEARS